LVEHIYELRARLISDKLANDLIITWAFETFGALFGACFPVDVFIAWFIVLIILLHISIVFNFAIK